MIHLRPYQSECKIALYDYYERGNAKNGLVVVPTAGGKSLIIGDLACDIVKKYPGQRILILSHVQELIKQNYAKIMLCWNAAPAGIYAASLNKRQAHFPIVVASIQSVYNKSYALGHRDLLFIDEAHLLQPGMLGMYGTLIAALLAINPYMKICGFTATDYRTDSGLLTEGEGAIFNDVIIEIPISRLLNEGYLTPPIGKSAIVQADMEGVKMQGGDFNIKQMVARFDDKAFIDAALDSDMPFFEGRNSIALFCATVEHAEHVAAGMEARGIPCETLDGEMSADNREDKLERFRAGKLRALASVGVMTTGTDVPNIDCLVIFRATASPGLYQQIIGRGFRVVYADGYNLDTIQGRIDAIRNGPKPNFLILDHGGNILRHGAITHVEKPQKREKGVKKKLEKPKVRICECCRTAWPLEVTICGICQTVLVVARDATANLDIEASHAEIMGTPFSRGEVAQWFDVDEVKYSIYQKAGKPPSFKVTYYSGILQFNEWIQFELGKSYSRSAMSWWGARSIKDLPANAAEALEHANTLKKPLRVMIRKKEKFYEVLRYEFNRTQQIAISA